MSRRPVPFNAIKVLVCGGLDVGSLFKSKVRVSVHGFNGSVRHTCVRLIWQGGRFTSFLLVGTQSTLYQVVVGTILRKSATSIPNHFLFCLSPSVYLLFSLFLPLTLLSIFFYPVNFCQAVASRVAEFTVGRSWHIDTGDLQSQVALQFPRSYTVRKIWWSSWSHIEWPSVPKTPSHGNEYKMLLDMKKRLQQHSRTMSTDLR